MLNDNIHIAKGFQTSVNIAFDLYNDEKVRAFIPTVAAMDVVEDIMLSTADASTKRSRILIGAYGRGKSHIILVALSLLFKKDKSIFQSLLDKLRGHNPDLCDFVNEYLDSDKRLLPVVVNGSSASLTQSFLGALQQALMREGLADLMPETHFQAAVKAIETWDREYPETYQRFAALIDQPVSAFILALREYDVTSYEQFVDIYPRLTSGSVFNPFLGSDVVELYERTVAKLPEYGFAGAYVVYDEFSKYLESSIATTSISDIKLLQDFAEKCDRSGANQMHLLLISHKDIANYIDSELPKEKVDGWRGVSGRFYHTTLHNNFTQMYEVIAQVIRKDEDFYRRFVRENGDDFEDLSKRFVDNGLFEQHEPGQIKTVVYDCYPLHPLSTFVLPRLSEKVAQNERTLFTFLSADEKHTLSAFLRQAEGDFPLMTPDCIYDYFEPLLRKEPYVSQLHKLYKLTATVLRKVKEGSLEAKIIKTISLIYAIEQFERVSPVSGVIVDTYRNSVADCKEITDALNRLVEQECVVYLKRSNGFLKLKESSGVDIPGEIDRAVEQRRERFRLTAVLNEFPFDRYFYPNQYNEMLEITRYFKFRFIDSEAFWAAPEDWLEQYDQNGAAGAIYAVIPDSQEEIDRIRMALLSDRYSAERVIFVVPKRYQDIRAMAAEYEAVCDLRTQADADELLSDEYDIYIEDLNDVLSSYIAAFTRPENGGAEYYSLGQRLGLRRKAHMSAKLSEICQAAFPDTPVINNESINRNLVSVTSQNSRTKVVTALLGKELNINLGFTGTGQEVSIMRSILVRPGILTGVDSDPQICLEPEDEKLKNVFRMIYEVMAGATAESPCRFSEIYRRLTAPELGVGLKRGVIPLFLAAFFHVHQKAVVVFCRGAEAKLCAELLNTINVHPEDYTVYLEEQSEDQQRYLADLDELFSSQIIVEERGYNSLAYLVYAMNRWYIALPKYAKEIQRRYLGMAGAEYDAPLTEGSRQFLSSVRQPAANPRAYLFEELPRMFGLQVCSTELLRRIGACKAEFEGALPALVGALISDLRELFAEKGTPAGASLASCVQDWTEGLSQTTLERLFPDGEERILRTLMAVTSDEDAFVRTLGKTATALRIDDWTPQTVGVFLEAVSTCKQTVEAFDRQQAQGEEQQADTYRIVFTDNQGQARIHTFPKIECGSRARLLRNEVESALEDMGQALSEQEKRQVLVEILESLC